MAKVTEPRDEQSADSREREKLRKDAGRPKFPKEPARMTQTVEKKDQTGFFTIYKRGDGYRTRMLTVGGGLLIAAFTAYFVHEQLLGHLTQGGATGVGLAVFILLGLLVHWLTNRPTSAEFLIATDSEMKKVNWTSRADLIGATKVVIFFMFFMAVFLFLVDQIFNMLFWWMGIVHSRPLFLSF